MFNRYPLLAVVALALGLVIAGCGSSGGSSSSSAQSEPTESASSESASSNAYSKGSTTESTSESAAAESESTLAAAPISVGTATDVGKVLVDENGMTLYYFEKDVKGSGKSTCSGACASLWPPLLTGGEPEGMSGVQASMLGTIERSDGTTQATYAGWPLYTFAGDKKPGEATGTDLKDFGASWYPLHTNGHKAGH